MLTRRQIFRAAGAGVLASSLPRIAFAQAETSSRFVLVILRGAADGLAIVPPYGDGNYESVRGNLALPAPGDSESLLKLDGLFGMHPSLQGIYDEYAQGRALAVHAIASPYRERSHFDGQDVLETGAAAVGRARDGWLNRALAPLGGALGSEPAIAMAQNTPLVLRGDQSVTSWAPSRLPDADESTLARLQDLYANDEFFATRLAQALRSQEIAAADADMETGRRRGNNSQQFAATMSAAARFLIADDGPRIAVVETSGWDTHANQGATTGTLANRLAGLDSGITSLRTELGDVWTDTVVAVVTEFGRTVHANGTRGTDHGTATAAILVGGAVNGGRVIADWPGLRESDLYEGRDLMPTADLRSLFKGLLIEHLGLSDTLVEHSVFPESASAAPFEGLILG